MLKRIIVGVKETFCSQAAIEVANAWAARHQSELLGISVVDSPRLAAPESVPLGAGAFKSERDQAVIEAAEIQADQCLADFARRCQGHGIPCQTTKLEGDPASLLVREAQRGDLLVVGHKGKRENNEETSDTLEQLLKHAPRPVLCVPQVSSDSAPVLIPYDGSIQAAKALHAFVQLGLTAQRQLHLLQVTPESQEGTALALAADYLALHGCHVEAEVAPLKESPATVILSEAVRLGVGLIVMGCYGRASWKEFFFGSVTKLVLRHSTVPIFLYH